MGKKHTSGKKSHKNEPARVRYRESRRCEKRKLKNVFIHCGPAEAEKWAQDHNLGIEFYALRRKLGGG